MQPDVCLTVVLDEVDNFLVIRRSKRNTRAGQWEPPLGHRDAGESPEDAALREVAEETGLSVQLLSGTTDKRSGDGKRIRLFLARASGTKPTVKTEPSEHDDHKWLTLDEMNALEDCHDTLKDDISTLLKANRQTKEANMLPTMQPGMGLPIAPSFSRSYQPRLAGRPNPLANVQAPAVAKADTSGIQAALAKTGSMCLSATGEGKHKYKVNPEDTASGEKAFESLDRFKRAGLNNFQASFFSRMVNEGRNAAQIKQAIDLAGRKFGDKVASELKAGFDNVASGASMPNTSQQQMLLNNPPKVVNSPRKDPFNVKNQTFGSLFMEQLQGGRIPRDAATQQQLRSGFINLHREPPPLMLGGIGNVASAGLSNAVNAGRHFLNSSKPFAAKLPVQINPTAGKAFPAATRPVTASNYGNTAANLVNRAGGNVATRGTATGGTATGAFTAKNFPTFSKLMPSTGTGKFLGGMGLTLGANAGVTGYANQLAGENLRNELKPYLGQAGQAFTSVQDLASQLGDPKSELAQGYIGEVRDQLLKDPRLEKLLALADKFDSDDGGFDLASMFAKNQNWLIPLLATLGIGAAGGGALGGTGGAIGGAIGLPLIYYLMQNPNALSQFTGGAPAAAKPPVAPAQPPAQPPAQQWRAPLLLPPEGA